MAHGNSQGLNCTANDVSLSAVSDICIIVSPPGGPFDLDEDGCRDPDSEGKLRCISGQPFTFSADFEMPLTAQDRYDLGLYIATDGGGDDGAYTGECAINVISEANGLNYYASVKDRQLDECGDITNTTAYNPQVIRQTITTLCNDPEGDGVNLPWCTSWRQPGSDELCDTTEWTSGMLPSDWDAYPGAPSKCNCGTMNIAVFSETASITVTKTASTPTVPETGGYVTYAVSVKNNALVASVTLDTFVDTDLDPLNAPAYVSYGDITSVHDDITGTDCTLATIAADATYNCSFTVYVAGCDAGEVIPDQVQACGTDAFGHSGLCDDDDASVTCSDVQTDPSLAKTAHATQAVAVDVQFLVAVTNNSTVDTLTLNSLTDNQFGDITSVQGNVLSTTCATGGTIAAGGTYNCSFVGRITSTGLHTDVVSGAATDDDGVNFGAPPLQDSAQVNITVTFP